MSKRSQLGTIRTLADSAERESSRSVSERHDALAAEERRLDQLRSYLQEYSQMSVSGASVFVDTVQMRRRFVCRIRTAIEQQEQLIADLRSQLDMDVQRWKDARSHSLALERYDERLADEASSKQARREQSRTDEVGQRAHHNS